MSDVHTNDVRINNIGKPINGIIYDIDGDIRDLINPDIGADEFDVLAIDLQAVSIIEPSAKYYPTGKILDIALIVKSHGIDTIGEFIAYFNYNGSVFHDTIITNLWQNQEDTVHFTTPLILTSGSNTLTVYIYLLGDTIQHNDTIETVITGLETFTLPYFDNFEVNNYFAIEDTTDWELGIPAANTINSANSPVNAWVTNLSGNASDGISYVYSPYFIIPGGNDTIFLKFQKWISITSNNSGGYIQYSKGNGLWLLIGYTGDPQGINWYADINNNQHYWGKNSSTQGWENTEYKLSPSLFNIGDTVQFRFIYNETNANVNEGMAIDDFSLKISKDIGVLSIDYPVNNTMVFSQITVKATVKNFGGKPQYNSPIKLSLNGVVLVTDTIQSVIAPGNTYQHTFSVPYTVPISAYTICANTALLNDFAYSNDSACKSYGVPPLLDNPGISAILSPLISDTICVNLSYYSYAIKVRIKNDGSNTLNSIPLEYDINNNDLVHETWTGILPSGDSVDYTFTSIWLPQAYGNLNLCARTKLIGDIGTSNDEACKTYLGYPCTGIDNIETDIFVLKQNVPNPTNGYTSIDVIIPWHGKLRFAIINQFGQLIDERFIYANKGTNRIEQNVSELSPGIYYYFVEFENRRLVRKMVIIRE